MKKKICIIDYGAGNILSLEKAIKYLGYKPVISFDFKDIKKFDYFFLPGVGAFPEAINSLKKLNIIEAVKQELKKKKKIFGICLGMQLLCQSSSEIKLTKGFGIVEAKVERLKKINNLPLPHIGFNQVKYNNESKLLKHIDRDSYFYFNHSYAIKKLKKGTQVITCYGENFVSLFENENIFATQFHPEKSQLAGLQMIKNFINL